MNARGSARGTQTLPGVDPHADFAPERRIDARREIEGARRAANHTDLVDMLCLFAVDAVFFSWQAAHIPGLDRRQSLYVLLVLHLAVAIHVIVRRKLPEWRARRIAATWEKTEQARYRK
jgi:hypothetical protein